MVKVNHGWYCDCILFEVFCVVLNINADVAAREMALSLKPCRVVFTSAKGMPTCTVSYVLKGEFRRMDRRGHSEAGKCR